MAIIFWFKHQCFPNLVKIGDWTKPSVEVFILECFSKDSADNVDHWMISWLSCWWCFLGRISNDTESWFISYDVDVLNVWKFVLCCKLWVMDHFLKTFQSSSWLMLIQTQLEVHTHNSKVTTLVWKGNIEWWGSISFFIPSKDWLRIGENILRSYKTSHCSLDTHKSSFSWDSCWSSFWVTQLFSCSDSSPRNVVSNIHANSVFNSKRRCSN